MDSQRPSAAPDLSGLRIEERARKPRTGKAFRVFAVGLGVLVLIAGLLLAFKGKTATVEVASSRAAGGAKGTALLNASGYVTPRRRATIAAKITGRVTGLFVEEGMHVREGQVLATLDDSDARARLLSAQADRDATSASLRDLEVQRADAERELRRAQDLQQGGVASIQSLDRARTLADSLHARLALVREQVRAADARIAVAKQDVENCTVRAPFAGLVVSKDAQVGEMVSPISAGGGFTRTGIATVVDMNSLEIEVDVNESYIARVRPRQRVTATLDAYPDWHMPGHVRTLIPTADRQKATVKVRLSFEQLDPRILPDMGIKVAFLDEQPSGAPTAPRVLIPRDAVREEQGKPFVFLYRDARLERRAVRLGAAQGSDVEVLAGVSPGEQVVVRPAEGLRDGQQVQLKP